MHQIAQACKGGMWGKALFSWDFFRAMHTIENDLIVFMAGIVSAICPCESVLLIRLRPEFSVVFEGYAVGAEHWLQSEDARKRSLRAGILRTS